MKPTKNIEEIIRLEKPHVTTGDVMDRRTLDDSFAAMNQVMRIAKTSITEVIFRSKATILTAASVLIIGLAIGALLGQDTWQDSGVRFVGKSRMAQTEPTVIYNLDYLTDMPKGSLADTYLTLVSTANGRELK